MKFEEWIRSEMDITLVTETGERKAVKGEVVQMAQRVRARTLADLIRKGPRMAHELIEHNLPADQHHVEVMRQFVTGVLAAMAEAGEVTSTNNRFTITEAGRAALSEAQEAARARKFMAPDNDRGRPPIR